MRHWSRWATALVLSSLPVVAGCTEALGPPALEVPEPTLPCHEVACDPVAQRCVEVPVVDGTTCDDGDACTERDRCVAGVCVSDAVSCDDDNGCTEDSCDAVEGCVHGFTTAACDDGDACTEGDVCQSGACVGLPFSCDDDEICTADACDPDVGCVNAPLPGLMGACGPLGQPCPEGFVCKDGATCESCAGDELFVPAGRFWMGCNAAIDGSCAADELPQHRVVVDAFAIQRTEVTAEAYAVCVDAGPCSEPTGAAETYGTYGVPEKADHPVTPVSWYQARGYCAWLPTDGPSPWRLCTEAEWEKAARGSCAQRCERADDDACCRVAMPLWPWGDEPASCERAIMDDGGNGCGTGVTWPVASRPDAASAFGALDMAGNVWEWVQDCWHPSYEDAPSDGLAWEEAAGCESGARVIRGGSFGLTGPELRASERYFIAPDVAYDYYGFRCCRSLH